ncbi:hypothetical protein EOA30_28640 [Mesorhizobium sp. M8A.F.Ca.ET.059.01.1.1]|nr:hypothetical protein EOA30_28640 [Mesorhizobium sp. M8A.F.Ca.ET.059.01.1.1]
MEAKEPVIAKNAVGLLNLWSINTRVVVVGSIALALFLSIYLMGRPLLYYSDDEYRKKALISAVGTIFPLLPDDKFDPSQVEVLISAVKPPLVISVGTFATAKVGIIFRPIASSTEEHPDTERWLRKEHWTPNAYLIVGAEPPTLQYNWDFIILAIGSAIVAIAGLWSFYPPAKVELALSSGSTTDDSARTPTPSPAESYMMIDVQRALDMSEQLFSRSTLLLVGGVVMSFIGVAVFFLSLFSSEISPSPVTSFFDLLSSPRFLLAYRAFAMLIFIEAIAWFLLRQYRSLIEDYKSFYRYYMRRANYLAALKISNQPRGDAQFALIVRTFLAEDLTGRLKRDETTETLEGQRLIDANFAESLMASAFDVMRKPKAVSAKPKRPHSAISED